MTRDELVRALAALRETREAPEPPADLLERAFPEGSRATSTGMGPAVAAGLLAAGALVAPFLRPNPVDQRWSEEATRIGRLWIEGAARGGLFFTDPSLNQDD